MVRYVDEETIFYPYGCSELPTLPDWMRSISQIRGYGAAEQNANKVVLINSFEKSSRRMHLEPFLSQPGAMRWVHRRELIFLVPMRHETRADYAVRFLLAEIQEAPIGLCALLRKVKLMSAVESCIWCMMETPCLCLP
jgi:hypothetical protein